MKIKNKRQPKVYFSTSIRGGQRRGRFLRQCVKYIQLLGAEVLSENVVAETQSERNTIFHKNTGISLQDASFPWKTIRRINIDWVDQADYLIAEVTAPSLGVGMEIQRALDKPKMGLNFTKILCLCQADIVEKDGLSWMIKGAEAKKENGFQLVSYRSFDNIKKIIAKFFA